MSNWWIGGCGCRAALSLRGHDTPTNFPAEMYDEGYPNGAPTPQAKSLAGRASCSSGGAAQGSPAEKKVDQRGRRLPKNQVTSSKCAPPMFLRVICFWRAPLQRC